MNKNASIECFKIAAFLYAMRYVAAAIYRSGASNFGPQSFKDAYGYIGHGLTFWAIIFAIAGLAIMVIPLLKKKSA